MRTTKELITKYLLSINTINKDAGLQIRCFELINGEIIGDLESVSDYMFYGKFRIDLLEYITYLYNNKHI